MSSSLAHSWDLDPAEARQVQAELAPLVDRTTPLPLIRTVAGADISYDRGGGILFAAVVVVDIETLKVVEKVSLATPATFPYVPGLLSFREAPPILQAFARLQSRPDVLITDGQGLAHPRRLGIACHLGLLLDIPTVGCAKKRLCGRHEEPGVARGDGVPLTDKGEVIGAVLRSRRAIKPLFISVGHRTDLESALALILRLTPRYRVPVPIRLAHVEVNRIRLDAREAGESNKANPPR